METKLPIVTSQEISRFRAELENYPDSNVIAALDALEQCEGYLEDAIPLLFLRETESELDRSVGDLLDKCREFICQEDVREALESGVIAPVIEPIAIGAAIPPGIATAVGILAFKLTIKKVCGSEQC